MKTQINYSLKTNSSKNIKIRNITIPLDKEKEKQKEKEIPKKNYISNDIELYSHSNPNKLIGLHLHDQKSKYISILNNNASMQFSQNTSNIRENEKISIPKEEIKRKKSTNIMKPNELNQPQSNNYNKEDKNSKELKEFNEQIDTKFPFEKKNKMHHYENKNNISDNINNNNNNNNSTNENYEIKMLEQIMEMKELNQRNQELIHSIKAELEEKHQVNLNLYNSYQHICFEYNCIKKKINSINQQQICEPNSNLNLKININNNNNNINDKDKDNDLNFGLKEKFLRNRMNSKKIADIQRSATLDKNKISFNQKEVQDIDSKFRVKQLSPTQNKMNFRNIITNNTVR